MKKFEYTVVSTQDMFYGYGKTQWNKMGQEGWELVSVNNSYGYFKREITE